MYVLLIHGQSSEEVGSVLVGQTFFAPCSMMKMSQGQQEGLL